jgi:hypothetical protein
MKKTENQEEYFMMCELALAILEMTDDEKKQNFGNAVFSDEDIKQAGIEIIRSLQNFIVTNERTFLTSEKTEYMIAVVMGDVQ